MYNLIPPTEGVGRLKEDEQHIFKIKVNSNGHPSKADYLFNLNILGYEFIKFGYGNSP